VKGPKKPNEGESRLESRSPDEERKDEESIEDRDDHHTIDGSKKLYKLDPDAKSG
jgi:hypothetical protein